MTLRFCVTGACLFLLLASSSGVAVRADPVLLPVDEGARRPDFFTFRAHLQVAVARRDMDAVLAAVDPSIRVSFGPDNGIDEFKRMWGVGKPGTGLWEELGEVLALGGSFQGVDSFVAPYVFSNWPAKLDAFEHVAVVGANVAVRGKPASDARIIESMNYSVLKVMTSVKTDAEWTAVQLSDGRSGFIGSRFVRSPIDYRAHFTYSSGRWRMTLFVAGD